MAIKADPPVMPLPSAWRDDPEIEPFIRYLQEAVRQIWERTGAGTDLVDGAAVDTGVVHLADAETVTGTKTFSAEQTFQEDINLSTGKAVNVGGKQIISDRGNAVADAAVIAVALGSSGAGIVAGAFDSAAKRDAVINTINNIITDLATLKTQLNAHLSRSRNHGLIEP